MNRVRHSADRGQFTVLVAGLLLAIGTVALVIVVNAREPEVPVEFPIPAETIGCCQNDTSQLLPPKRRSVRTEDTSFTARQKELLALARQLQHRLPRSFPRINPWPIEELARLDSLEIVTTILTAPGLDARGFTLSPDGNFLAVSFGGDEVFVWNTSSGETVLETGGWQEHRVEHATDLKFSPDGRHLLLTSEGLQKTSSWTLADRKFYYRGLRGEAHRILEATETLPTLLLTTNARRNVVELWDLDHGGEMPRTVIPVAGIPGYYSRLAVSPEAGVFALQPNDGHGSSVSMFDLDSGALLQEFDHGGLVGNFTFTPDGSLFLTAGYDDTVHLWDVDTGGLLASRTLRGPVIAYACYRMPMVFTAGGRYLVLSLRRPEVTVLDLPSLEPVGRLGGTVDMVEEIYLFPDGKNLLVRGGGEVFLRTL